MSDGEFSVNRADKKAAGLRELRMWTPDTRPPEFIAEAQRQAALLNHSADKRKASAMMRRRLAEARRDWT